jgi:O-acetyl-ADP-ribose deacetylase (regulator of RNase III)
MVPIGARMPPTMEVVQGDITEADVDAIVNAANDHLWMGSGVAGAIVRAGGAGIEAEAMRQGPVKAGQAVITGAGRLRARHVIHAAVMGQDLRTDGGKISEATTAALELAEQHEVDRIAFPALGAGVGGFPIEECARLMQDAVKQRHESSIRSVRFVLFDEAAYLAFRRVLRV